MNKRYPKARMLKMFLFTLFTILLFSIAYGQTDDTSTRINILKEKLKDSRGETRLDAVRELARINDSQAVEPLIAALKDNWGSIREIASMALGELKDIRAVEPLIAAMKDGGVGYEGIVALGRLKDTRAVEPLITVLKDSENYSHRTAAAFALVEIKSSRAIQALIDEEAYNALLLLTDSRAVEPLISALKHHDGYMRERAARALGKLKDTRAVEPLIAAFKDPDYKVRESAAFALGDLQTESSIQALIDEAANANSTDRWVALQALTSVNDERTVEPMINALKDKNALIRERAARRLEELKDVRAVEALIAALKDNSDNVRCYAADALGEIKDPRAVEPLISALGDKNISDLFRRAAQSAIREIGESALEALSKALENQNPAIRANAAKTLGLMRETRAINLLITSLSDQNTDVRKQASRSLIIIGAKSRELFAIRMSDDTGWMTLYRGAEDRGKIYNADIAKVLRKALKDGDTAIVAGAYPFFINNGERDSESILIDALESFGDKLMAFDFLNCGNTKLKTAAEFWGYENGYSIKRWKAGSEDSGPIWGNR